MGKQATWRISYRRLKAHGQALGTAQKQLNDDVREAEPLIAVIRSTEFADLLLYQLTVAV